MKVSIYPREDGKVDILVQASPGKGRSPVVLAGVDRSALKAVLLPAVVAARGPKKAEEQLSF